MWRWRDSGHQRWRLARSLMSTLIIVVGLFVGLPSICDADSRTGSVSDINGTVRLDRNGQTSTPVLTASVFLNDRYTTEPASSLAIALAGGASIEEGESSSIVIDQNLLNASSTLQSTQIGLLNGILHSVVAHLTSSQSFTVRTENAICGVRGTDFTVTFSHGYARPGYGGCGDYTDVSVSSGTVTVANLQNPSVTVVVNEGYATTVPCLHAPLTPGPVGLAAAGVPTAPAAAPPPPICPPCAVFGGHMH